MNSKIILPYEKLKSKQKKKLDRFDYTTDLLNEKIAMLDFTGFPETVDTNFLKLYAVLNGFSGVAKFPDGNYYAYEHSFTGEINAYNYGSESIGVNPKGSITKTIGKDCAILWNNPLGVPDLPDINSTADLLTEADASIRCLLLYSRLAPILLACDETTKTAVMDAMQSIKDGGDIKVISTNILAMLENATGQPVNKIDLTDATLSDKLQYISHFKDDVLRQWHIKNGHATQGTGKMAQQTIAEISGQDSVSWILPLQKLEKAKEFCAECNKLFGWNTSVMFSPCWQKSYEQFIATESFLTNNKEIENENTENV